MCDNDYSESIVALLKRVHLGTRKAFDDELLPYNLTGPQFEILRQVGHQDGLEQRVLQERLGITSATLTGIVDGLVERHLIRRCLSPDDARVKQLFLTTKGQTLADQLALITGQVQTRLLKGFPQAELALFKDWLRRMVTNIGASQTDSCD